MLLQEPVLLRAHLMSMALLQIWTIKEKLCFAPHLHFALLKIERLRLQARLARKTRPYGLIPRVFLTLST